MLDIIYFIFEILVEAVSLLLGFVYEVGYFVFTFGTLPARPDTKPIAGKIALLIKRYLVGFEDHWQLFLSLSSDDPSRDMVLKNAFMRVVNFDQCMRVLESDVAISLPLRKEFVALAGKLARDLDECARIIRPTEMLFDRTTDEWRALYIKFMHLYNLWFQKQFI